MNYWTPTAYLKNIVEIQNLIHYFTLSFDHYPIINNNVDVIYTLHIYQIHLFLDNSEGVLNLLHKQVFEIFVSCHVREKLFTIIHFLLLC